MRALASLLPWAAKNHISLDGATISPGVAYASDLHVDFWQYKETRTNFQNVKRAIDGFEREGTAPNIYLRKVVAIEAWGGGEIRLSIDWNGAMKCEKKSEPVYDCVPANFAEEPEEEEGEAQDDAAPAKPGPYPDIPF